MYVYVQRVFFDGYGRDGRRGWGREGVKEGKGREGNRGLGREGVSEGG